MCFRFKLIVLYVLKGGYILFEGCVFEDFLSFVICVFYNLYNLIWIFLKDGECFCLVVEVFLLVGSGEFTVYYFCYCVVFDFFLIWEICMILNFVYEVT